jgi:hypothetical protein
MENIYERLQNVDERIDVQPAKRQRAPPLQRSETVRLRSCCQSTPREWCQTRNKIGVPLTEKVKLFVHGRTYDSGERKFEISQHHKVAEEKLG